MSSLALPSTSRVRSSFAARDRVPAASLAIIGGVVAVVGAAMPWLSFFAGLQPITGLDGLSGQAAAVLGAGAVTAGLLLLVTGLPLLRHVIAALAFAILAIAAWSGASLIATLAELQADPLVVAQPEAGLPVLAAGGALAFATMFLPMPSARDARVAISESTLRSILAGSLALAGIAHLTVGQEHLASSPLVGAGMLVAGVGQLGLALVALRGPAVTWPMVAAVGVSLLLAAAYVVAVTIGLPSEVHAHAETVSMVGHGTLGHTEPVTPAGAATLGLELLSAAVGALVLAGRRRGVHPATVGDESLR